MREFIRVTFACSDEIAGTIFGRGTVRAYAAARDHRPPGRGSDGHLSADPGSGPRFALQPRRAADPGVRISARRPVRSARRARPCARASRDPRGRGGAQLHPQRAATWSRWPRPMAASASLCRGSCCASSGGRRRASTSARRYRRPAASMPSCCAWPGPRRASSSLRRRFSPSWRCGFRPPARLRRGR